MAELRQLVSEWTANDCQPKESDDEHLHAGFTAFGEGLPHSEFLSDDRAKAKQWITGWVSAERLKSLKAAEKHKEQAKEKPKKSRTAASGSGKV